MAILVEEEKKPVNWFSLVVAVLFVLIVFVGGYYVFFRKPELIEVVIPQSLDQVNKLSKVSINTEKVFDSVFFKLPPKQYGFDLTSEVPGKSNPFTPF